MLVVGLATSLFQSVTGVQESTLTFAPEADRVLRVSGLLLAPWLLHSPDRIHHRDLRQRMTAMAH